MFFRRFINRLPTELLSRIFDLASEEDNGAIIHLSHVCSYWRRTALSSPRAWSKIMADLSLRSGDPKIERTLTYLARSGACPVDVQFITSSNGSYDSSNGVMEALCSNISRWRSFSLHCSDQLQDVCSDVIASLNGRAPSLEELRLVFQPSSRAHGEHPHLPEGFLLRAPSLGRLHLNGVGANLVWIATLQNLHTLELIQNNNSPLAYSDLLYAISRCAASLRGLKVHATISSSSDFSGIVTQTPLVLPSLRTLDLILKTSPVASLLADIEAPNLESLSLQDVQNPSDRWCSFGLRSFLRQQAPRLRQLRVCSLGLEDDELIWVLTRVQGLESLEIIHSVNTDVVLRMLSQSIPDTAAETWVVPALRTLTLEQCHQMTGKGVFETMLYFGVQCLTL